jgi:N-acetylmuramoyl-L-alanine amidase
MKPRSKTELIIIHCADTYETMEIGASDIRKWHVEERGWSDIGYHKVIRRDGTVEAGRDIDVSGAHASGHNSVSVGVCLVGGRGENDEAENNFTPQQFKSLASVIDELLASYPDSEVLGHRDLPDVQKECPAFDVRSWMSETQLER